MENKDSMEVTLEYYSNIISKKMEKINWMAEELEFLRSIEGDKATETSFMAINYKKLKLKNDIIDAEKIKALEFAIKEDNIEYYTIWLHANLDMLSKRVTKLFEAYMKTIKLD